jgi:hypothetical protein
MSIDREFDHAQASRMLSSPIYLSSQSDASDVSSPRKALPPFERSEHVNGNGHISQAPDAFKKFDQRIDGYIKVVLDPQR